jgi:hypothetical protein
MRPEFTRRDFLRIGTVSAAAGLAGCSFGGGDTTPGSQSTPDSEAAGPTQPESSIGAVTEVLLRTPLEIQVQQVTEVDTLETFGIEVAVQEGMVGYAVRVAFKNASNAYISFVTDELAMLADEDQVAEVGIFGAITSASFGGVALAPGEVRSFDLAFEAPSGASRYGVAARFRVRTFPGTEFVSVPRIVVDFADDGGQEPLAQTLDVPFRSMGETVGVGGARVTVREIFFADEAGRGQPREGEEFGIADVRLENESTFPLAVGIGVGGWAFQDDIGNIYTSRRGAEGSVGERELIDLPNGLRPGESVDGLIAGAVPRDVDSLFLTFTPPPVLFVNAPSAPENKFFWTAR